MKTTAPRWFAVPFLLGAAADAQAAPAGEGKLPAAWSPRAAYAFAVLQDMVRELDALAAAGGTPRASRLDQGQLWFCGYHAQLVQCAAEDAVPTAVIWPREPAAPLWGLYAFPAEPAPAPECVFFLAPGTPLLWSENRTTNYHAGSIPSPAAALGRGGNRTWSARQRSAGTGEDGELWQLASTMPLASLGVVVRDEAGAGLPGAEVRLVPAHGLPITDLLPPGVPLRAPVPAGCITVDARGAGTTRGVSAPNLVVRVSLAGTALGIAPNGVATRDGTLYVTAVRDVSDGKYRAACELTASISLRNVASGQAQCMCSGVIDVDRDGNGEYGFFAELGGVAPIRTDAAGSVGAVRIEPPVLSEQWARVQRSRLERSGYRFQMYLRASDGSWVTEHADGDGGRGVAVDPDRAEQSWCCLAWPVRAGWTGQPVYFVDQDGDVLVLANTDGAFSGDAAPRPWTSPQPPAGWTVAVPSGIPRDNK